jgi:hypothetical protein
MHASDATRLKQFIPLTVAAARGFTPAHGGASLGARTQCAMGTTERSPQRCTHRESKRSHVGKGSDQSNDGKITANERKSCQTGA